jgi:arylsulfatase A-like enzyme
MNYQISPELLSQVLTPFETYVHKMNGLFIAAGPNIVATGDLKREISILDVAPTIMHLAGLSVPDDMDGQVQNEIFKDGSEPARRRVSYRKSDYEKLRMIKRIHKLKELGRL